jgi:hypothetical protein
MIKNTAPCYETLAVYESYLYVGGRRLRLADNQRNHKTRVLCHVPSVNLNRLILRVKVD